MGKARNTYRILVGKLEGKKTFGKPRCRLEDIIRMDLGKIGWGKRGKDKIRMNPKKVGWRSVEWIHLAQDREHWLVVVNIGFHKKRDFS